MPRRKVPLVNNELYHICTKSIAGFKIFNSHKDYERMLEAMRFYMLEKPPCKFCLFKELKENNGASRLVQLVDYTKRLVDIVAYCIMPTHIHLLLKQLKEDGISIFSKLLLKSYSQYFNLKHKRKGPLWESRFENILIENDDQLLHVTRYIHLNPVTAHLVDDPKNWKYSSYGEYIGLVKKADRLCEFSAYHDMKASEYVKFVKDAIGYQRELALIKHLTLE